MPVITISRQSSSLGDEIAESVSRRLGFELIDRDALLIKFLPDLSAHEKHMLSESAKFYLNTRGTESYISLIGESLHEYVKSNSVVLLGFGGRALFSGEGDALHVRITAPPDTRASRIRKRYRISAEEALFALVASDKRQARFVRTVFGGDISDPLLYDMVLNTASLSADECAAAIISLFRERELNLRILTPSGQVAANASEAPVFKNQAESEFAHLLDMYNIEWKYEPKTFPIEWDAEGNVTKAFSPDFYLVKFDTYIEITAMNQKYVTEKNSKLKRMRKLYPGTNVRIVYKKDFNSLVERFNLGKDS